MNDDNGLDTIEEKLVAVSEMNAHAETLLEEDTGNFYVGKMATYLGEAMHALHRAAYYKRLNEEE